MSLVSPLLTCQVRPRGVTSVYLLRGPHLEWEECQRHTVAGRQGVAIVELQCGRTATWDGPVSHSVAFDHVELEWWPGVPVLARVSRDTEKGGERLTGKLRLRQGSDFANVTHQVGGRAGT